jgi:hypothetical protein
MGIVALDRLRTNLTLLLIAGYILLNLGFMMLRVPPGGKGAPLGEIWLAFMLATIFLDLRMVRPFVNWAPAVPLFLWWLVGLTHLVIDVPQYGFWAIRDAGHWMEANYLWVGFALASRPEFYQKFEKWLRLVFNISVCYMLTYPFGQIISNYSPKVNAVAGYSIPIVGNYVNASGNVMTQFFRLLLERRGSMLRLVGKVAITGAAMVVMVFFLQMRTAYLQLVAATALLLYCRPRSLGRFGLVLLAGLIMGALLLNLNLNLAGRTGEKFTVSFLLDHIQAIWGGGGYDVRGSAGGVDLRFGWWQDVFNRVNSSVLTAFFGLGFGFPLTNFHALSAAVVREVHNSLVSTYGRMGLVGLLLFLTIQFRVFFVGLRLIATLKRLGKHDVAVTIATTLCFMAMSLVFAQFEPGMELSYVCIPHYFFGGIILGLNRRIRLEIRAHARAPAKAS